MIARIVALFTIVASCAMAAIGAEKDVAQNFNDLGFDLLRKISRERPNENVLVSPLSLGLSLALVDQGANATAHTEVTRALHTTGLNREEVRRGASNLLTALKGDAQKASGSFTNPSGAVDGYFGLTLAQSIWIDRGVEVKAPFLASAQRDFGSEIKSADFSARTVCADMNAWVAERTRGKISSVECPSTGGGSPTVLLNAVYFRDAWTSPFQIEKSEVGKFRGAQNLSRPKFMKRELKTSYARGRDATVVSLWYQSAPFVMDLILPNSKGGLGNWIAKCDGKKLSNLVESAQSTELILKLPRFEFRRSEDVTESLALKHARVAGAFPEIAEATSLDKIIQQTYINVNESGTEAAAVTEMFIVTMGMNHEPPRPKTVVFDRSFIFTIRHSTTGALLFLGLVNDLPDAEK